MKKQVLFLTAMLLLLIAAGAAVAPVSVQHDFNAYLGNAIEDAAIDGAIGSEWEDAGSYADVAISPQGTAEIWTKNDGTYLYMTVRFTADNTIHGWHFYSAALIACNQERMALFLDMTDTPEMVTATSLSTGTLSLSLRC